MATATAAFSPVQRARTLRACLSAAEEFHAPQPTHHTTTSSGFNNVVPSRPVSTTAGFNVLGGGLGGVGASANLRKLRRG